MIINHIICPSGNQLPKTVYKTVTCYWDTRSDRNWTWSGRPKSAIVIRQIFEVCISIVENVYASIRKLRNRLAVNEILIANKLHPYKMTLTHELLENNFNIKLEFREEMRLCDKNRQFSFLICFSYKQQCPKSCFNSYSESNFWNKVQKRSWNRNMIQCPKRCSYKNIHVFSSSVRPNSWYGSCWKSKETPEIKTFRPARGQEKEQVFFWWKK